MRLIDGDEALEIVRNQGIAHPNAYHLTNYATLILREAPTVDAVEVVRCKDCRYRGLICCPAIHETIGNGLVDYATDNGYCWRGKPKET